MISFFFPLRKGSKRVRNKNIKKIHGIGKSLLEIKIDQLYKFKKKYLKKFKDVEFVFFSDCPVAKKIISKFRWLNFVDRSQVLSGDNSLQKVINLVPKICKYDLILWSHVTSPMFDEKEYYNFLKVFLMKKKNNRSAFSADKFQKFLMRDDGKWISHKKKKNLKWPKTQSLKYFYIVNSAAFISTKNNYLKYHDRLCSNPIPIETGYGKGFDVDTFNDFKILANNYKKFI